MENMAQVVQWIETETPFSSAFQKKVIGSVRKMEKLPQYGVSLDLVPLDLEAFDATWGRGPVRGIPSGFSSKSSFSTWRSQVRSAMSHAIGSIPPMPREHSEDEWDRLSTDIIKQDVPKQKLIAVSVLADAARRATLGPHEVSRPWLQEIVDTADTAGQYQAIQAAVGLISKNRGALSMPLSPAFDGSPIHKSRSHCVRAPLPEGLAREIRAWECNRLEGERKGHRRKRKSACTPERAKQALRGVTYVYTAMLEAGLISAEENCTSFELRNELWLEEVIERELNSEFPWASLKTTTLFEYVNNWKLFIRGCGHDAEPIKDVIGDFSEFENIKAMSVSRRSWCEEFLNDHRKQTAFLGLPQTLFLEAKEAMSRYDEGSQHNKTAAIALGVAACAAAIWTSLPLRVSTLLRLSYGAPEADVQLHGTRKGLILTTPPDIVKNGYSHRSITLTPKRGGDPQEIVAWFVSVVRPKLLAAHIKSDLRRADLLFGGVSYSRMASIWRHATLEAGVPMTPHQVRHALATLMANQPNADYSIIASLLGDTEATVRKNYVFVDQARKHEEAQKILTQLQGNILMRGAA